MQSGKHRSLAQGELGMATVALKKRIREFGPRSAGVSMTLQEFDRVEVVEGYPYELINGVLIVSPIPSPQEHSPNEELAYWLLLYRDNHPKAGALNGTLPEHTVRTPLNRRRADRISFRASVLSRPCHSLASQLPVPENEA
jgi:hypothetical protein